MWLIFLLFTLHASYLYPVWLALWNTGGMMYVVSINWDPVILEFCALCHAKKDYAACLISCVFVSLHRSIEYLKILCNLNVFVARWWQSSSFICEVFTKRQIHLGSNIRQVSFMPVCVEMLVTRFVILMNCDDRSILGLKMANFRFISDNYANGTELCGVKYFIAHQS